MKSLPRIFLVLLLTLGVIGPVFSEETPAPPEAVAEQAAASDQPVPSAAPVPVEKSVKSVLIVGNKTISSSLVLSKVKTKPQEAYKKTTVDEDIKRIYGLGYFSDVKAEVKEYADGIEVIFIVTEKPPIGQIVFAGNKAFRDERLKKELKIKPDEILDERQLKEGIRAIREMYYRKGYTHS